MRNVLMLGGVPILVESRETLTGRVVDDMSIEGHSIVKMIEGTDLELSIERMLDYHYPSWLVEYRLEEAQVEADRKADRHREERHFKEAA